jgi:hypothetical protein
MIRKFLEWALSKFSPAKDETLNAWPFPVVLGTPPYIAEKKVAKKRGRPASKKVPAKTVAKKKVTKKVK